MGSDYQSETYLSISDLNENQWNDLVTRSELGSVFHRYEWLRGIESGRDVEPRHVVVSKDGNPMAVFPNFIEPIPKTPFKRLVSIPAGGFCGPVLSKGRRELFDLLFDEIPDVCSGNVIEHRMGAPNLQHAQFGLYLEDRGYSALTQNCRMIVDLEGGWERVKDRMSKSKRKRVEPGDSSRVEVTAEDATERNLRAFYRNYRTLMERVGGRIWSWEYFSALETVADDLDEGSLVTFSMSVDGENHGRLMCLSDPVNERLLAYLSGINASGFEHDVTEVLHGAAMRHAIEAGHRSYDFWMTPCAFDDGMFRRKRELGAEPVPLLEWHKTYAPGRRWLLTQGEQLYARYLNDRL